MRYISLLVLLILIIGMLCWFFTRLTWFLFFAPSLPLIFLLIVLLVIIFGVTLRRL